MKLFSVKCSKAFRVLKSTRVHTSHGKSTRVHASLTPRKQFLWIKETFLWYTVKKKKILWIEESFVNSKTFSLIQRNRFVYIKEHFLAWTKLSLIQRNFLFYRISKNCFFDSKKLFSQCRDPTQVRSNIMDTEKNSKTNYFGL